MDELNQLYDQLRKAEKMADAGDQEAAADAKAIFAEIQRLEASKPTEQTSTEKPGVAATIGNALGITGLPVDAAGATVGALAGATVKPSAITEMVDPVVHAAIKPFPAMPEPKGPVQKYVEGTGDTPYAGGKTYSSGYKKSLTAAGEPVQSRGSNQPIRKGNLGIGNQLDAIDRIKNYAATPAQPMGRLGSSLKLGVAGELTGKTIEDIKAGKYGQAGLDALQAAVAAAGASSYKPARIAGNLIAGKEILGGLAPFFGVGGNEQKPEEKAEGGSIQGYAGGGRFGANGPHQFGVRDVPDYPQEIPERSMAAGGAIQGYQVGSKVVSSLAKKFGYDAAKLAEDYPQTLFPRLSTDEKTGKLFAEKVTHPEAEALKKARMFAQKEIAKGDYQPFFDITKRAYVDPSQYPLSGNTLIDAMPKTADTIAKYEAIAKNPEALAQWQRGFETGNQRPLAKDWYAMKQLQDEFIKRLGPEEGVKQFKARFADPMGATTGGADPSSNLMTAAYTNLMRQRGVDIPQEAFDVPYPVYGRFLGQNLAQAQKLHETGGLSAATQPKRHNFSGNFLGHRDLSTLDEQMMSVYIDPKTGKPFTSPPGNAYGLFQRELNNLADKNEVMPGNFQDVTWAGLKDYPGKPMIQEINEMLHRTSRVGDISQEQAMDNFVRANKPVYRDGGLVHLSNGGMPNVSFDVEPMVARENPFVPRNAGMPMNVPLGAMAKMKFEKELEDARLRAAISAQGMVLPNQPGVKVMPGAMEFGANIPVGRGNIDIGAHRSLAPVPGRGHMQGVNFNYSTKFAGGGKVGALEMLAKKLMPLGEREADLIHLAGGGIPKEVVKAYKLFRTKPNEPETLYPLFVNANKPVPLNEWVQAEVGPVAASGKVKSKLGELAYRPGWHAGDLPIATHIGGKSAPGLKAPDFRRPEEVWAEVEMPNDIDWQTIANQRAELNKAGKIIPRTAHITDELPLGGHYRYKTSPNMEGNWLIGGDMKVNRILTDEEVQAINEAAGKADLPRFTPLRKK